MKRWLPPLCIFAAATVCLAAPLTAGAAEEAPSSPLYAPNQGLITGTVTIVVFAFLLAVLGKYAWGPILSGLRAREEKIRKDISDAEATRAKAEATLREYAAQLASAQEKVQQMLSKATTDAEQLAASLRTRAQQESEEIKERATREIQAAKDQALSEIYQQTADLATRVAEKIIRRNLNAGDQHDLVNQSLQELQTVGAR
jgi:F-type H+-transporting ATPase subunit b